MQIQSGKNESSYCMIACSERFWGLAFFTPLDTPHKLMNEMKMTVKKNGKRQNNNRHKQTTATCILNLYVKHQRTILQSSHKETLSIMGFVFKFISVIGGWVALMVLAISISAG